MTSQAKEVLLVAVPETAGSALYGMLDVLNAAGNIWQTLTHEDPLPAFFRTRILSPESEAFCCGNDIPVHPQLSVADDPIADIIVLPELWLGPEETLSGRYPDLMEFLRHSHQRGSYIYSACSGALMLAETGLLDGKSATSHWGYSKLFKAAYPAIEFQPEPVLCFADGEGRVVTAGGTSSWHDLAIHIIARHGSAREAMRIAKVYLLKWHTEGQLPYAPLVMESTHRDREIDALEQWLAQHFVEANVVEKLVDHSGLAERTLKRRFKRATGETLIERVQKLRIESAKQELESSREAIDEISISVGYEDASFFRRVFKRLTGVTPSEYRRMFGQQPAT